MNELMKAMRPVGFFVKVTGQWVSGFIDHKREQVYTVETTYEDGPKTFFKLDRRQAETLIFELEVQIQEHDRAACNRPNRP